MALIPLREAIEVYVHNDSAVGLGKTLIVQGRIFCRIEKYEEAIQVLNGSQRHLPEERSEFARYHFCVYQSLAKAHEQLGNLQEARMLLARASTFVGEHDRVRQAALTWQKASLCHAEGEAARAEALLHVSRQGLEKRTNAIQKALVSVDLVRSQLRQEKFRAACNTASSAARYLEPLEDNPIAEAALLELTRAGITDVA